MKKGYWVVRAHISNIEDYTKYVSMAGHIVAKFEGKFIVRGGDQEEVEGSGFERTVLVEFPSYQIAKNCYKSDEYQDALSYTRNSSNRHFSIVEGLS
ncbi:DUF1330 domain-containing protein [Gammaproteobacteria bacterium]|nr:DUF1330 domain-containing protein [Gammaproteobacteria bacterium]MDC3359654.1 DUF1330 domain-containing protein [Gammaproteobacteria bacterium]